MKSDGVRSVGKTRGIIGRGGGEDFDVNFDVGNGDVRVEDDTDATDEIDEDTCCVWHDLLAGSEDE